MKLFIIALVALLITYQTFVAAADAATVVERRGKKTNRTPIEHVVVLMLENRSFDHYMGLSKATRPEVNGCLPEEAVCSNPRDPDVAGSPVYSVNANGINVQASPSHSVSGVTSQIFSHADQPTVADMKGFVRSYAEHSSEENAPRVMDSFSPEHIPILSTLAEEYLLFDGWFSSVPGPTEPNRCFAAAASSNGMATNDVERMLKGLPNKTMFRQLEEMGLDWNVYFELIPAVLMFKDMRHKDARGRYHLMSQFFTDVAKGSLPEYTWLEPNYYAEPNRPPNDQHPDHNMADGELLIKDVYEALRASPAWNSTAFIITWDEHGGFFDHVVPPNPVPSPDGIVATDDPFDFTRLGVRVPTLVVSPWVQKGAVQHAQPSGEGQFEHSSLAATVVHKLFGPATGRPEPKYLNARDAWAATFEQVFLQRSEPRADSDCPATLPEPFFGGVAARAGGRAGFNYTAKVLNDLQQELLPIVAGATEDSSFDVKAIQHWTDADAVAYVRRRFQNYFSEAPL